MKRILLAGTAIVGLAALATPAHAELKLNLGGYFSGYGVYADNNEPAATSLHNTGLRRDSELHVSGESTLDNGLTVGFHTEQALGGNTATDEAYAYFSGGWGRANLGSEDGAAYLLQVAAPSADSNVDGLRTYIQAITPSDIVFAAGTGVPGLPNTGVLDYDQVSDPTAPAANGNGNTNTDRLTYLTPKFNGFQAGASYAPQAGQLALGNNIAPMTSDVTVNQFEDIWEVGARWDGEFQGFGISVGGGYSDASLEAQATALALVIGSEDTAPLVTDGVQQWNAGANVTWSGFSLGGSFLRAQTENTDVVDPGNSGATWVARSLDVTQDTWTVGLGWDNGPYHLGGSWLRTDTERDASGIVGTDDGALAAVDATAERFTVGGGYTYGPGMTFRGAVAWGEFDNSTPVSTGAAGTSGFLGVAANNNDFTQVTIGTEIDF